MLQCEQSRRCTALAVHANPWIRGVPVLRIIDITGEIRTGMWNYEPPFPSFSLRPLPQPPWVNTRVYCEIFDGLHSQTGTYLETPAHYFGNDRCYLLSDVPAAKLFDLPCTLLMLPPALFEGAGERVPVTREMLENTQGAASIREGYSILVGTGWGNHWMEPCYLEKSPYFTYDAMAWLIGKKPYLLGSDMPRWESFEHPQGFFRDFYEADILMLAPCVRLEQLGAARLRLTALPLHVPGTSCAPCRAVAAVED